MPRTPHPRGRLGKYARRALIASGGLGGLVLLSLAFLLVSLRFAKVRGYVVSRINAALTDSFQGRLRLHTVRAIGLTGIRAADAEVFDPAGRRVLDLHGLDVTLNLPKLAWAVLSHGSKPLTLRLDTVALQHAEVFLVDDGSGTPTLVDAFAAKTPSPPSSGPGVVFLIARAELAHVWAHGGLSGSPPLDVELKNASGALRSAPEATGLTIQRAQIQARGLPQAVDPSGQLEGSLDIPAAADQPLGARAHYQGTAAAIPVVLDASFTQGELVAKLAAPQVPPAAVSKLIPGLELRSPASLTASAKGRLPAVHGTFALGVGTGKVEGDLDLLLKDELTVQANVRAASVDAAELSRAAPSSKLDFTLHTALAVPKTGPMTGSFELSSQPSLISAQSLPALALRGTFSNDARAQRAWVQAHAEIAEPGAHTSVDATLERAERTAIAFHSDTQLKNPARLAQLAQLQLLGEVHAQGSYQVEAQRVDAEVRADIRDLTQGPSHVDHATLRGTIKGVLPHPLADVRLDLTDASLAGVHVADAQLAARGSLARLAVSAEANLLVPRRHIQLSVVASNQGGITLDHPSLNLSQGDTNLKLSAVGVRLVDGRTTISNLHLEGAGSADASLVYGAGLESATVQADELDLARVWRLLDGKAPLKSGTATLGLRYQKNGAMPHAELTLRADNLSLNRITGGSLNADLTLKNGQIDGSAQADLKHMGKLSFTLEELRGVALSNLDPARMSGKLTLEGRLQLRDLAELVPRGSDLPIARARGEVEYDASVERAKPGSGMPSLHLHVSTKQLQLAGARQSKLNITTRQEALDAAPTAIKGLNFDLDLKHAESGESELLASVKDAHGPLASLSIEGKAAPPLSTALTQLSREWRQIPLSVRLTLPPRELDQLPVEVRPAGLSGVVSGELGYDGTLSAPTLKISGSVLHFRQTELKTAGLDLAWQAAYSEQRGSFKGTARSGQREVGKADIDFETAIADWLNQGAGPRPALGGNAVIDLDAFPIGLLPGTQTSQVDGALSGKVELTQFGKDCALKTQLEAKPFKVGQTELGRITVDVLAKDGKAHASLRVEDKQGVTTADAHSGFSWGSNLLPTLALPADATLRAKAFRLATVAPFLASSFGELDGRVNGDLNAHFKGGAPELDGHIDLDDGSAQIASLGQRFDQIKGRVTLVPGKVVLESLSAQATSGKLGVTGEANFAGLNLTDAAAHVRISKTDAIAVSVAGTDIGDCWGAIDVQLKPGSAERSANLAVNVTELHVHIPDTGSQNVQGLEPAKEIRIGTKQREGDFVTLPLQPLSDSEPAKNERPMIVDLTLGKQIWLQRGDSTKIQLTGKTQLTLGDPATMTGQIDLRGGKLDVSGKQFEIESGTITFSGEPGNPTIVATARWDAPDDEQHRVYADYSGTVKKGKIVLRSEPPLTEDQVLSLLLTGSADGSIGGSSGGGGGTAATAVGAVGGAATQGLNKALSNISSLDVSTRVDTSTGSARPEVVVQISPKVSAALTRALGAPAPGQPPDLTFLTFDFRIRSRWSLSALVGDRGESGLDLIWRRRY